MKPYILLLVLFIPLFYASSPDDFYNPSKYFPVLMERNDLERSITLRDAQEVINPGKIYYKDQVIYLNEKYRGIHIIDNHDPAHPENIGFINIPGCIDIAIKNNSLFADNATDLIAISLANSGQITVTERIQNAFPESTPPDLDYIPYMFSVANRPRNTIIVGWEKLDN